MIKIKKYWGKIVFAVVLVVAVAAVGYIIWDEWLEPKASYFGTDSPEVLEVRADLKELVKDLRKQGLYKCCIRNDCNWCAIYLGYCPCESLVKREGKEQSCPECAAAWNKKQGRIPGVDPKAIEVITFGIYGIKNKGVR